MRLLRWAGLSLLVAAVCAFPWGPLFPWSPWKPGWERVALQRADVYYPSGSALPEAYRQLDAYIGAGEVYLRLPATKRITVVMTKDWGQFRRFLPWIRGNGVGAVTLATGTVVYVSPKLNERRLDHGEFLRHELAHALVHQHQSLWNAYSMRDAQWLSEGLCVSFGNQKAYVTREEFLRRAKSEDVAAVIEHGAADMRFAYVAWRSFVEYLVHVHGRDRFQVFLEKVMRRPAAWRVAFDETFGMNFAASVQDFARSLPAN